MTLASNPEDTALRDPNALIDTATLATSLGDPSLRVFDCTTRLDPTPAGSAEPYIAVPCREAFEEGHVPGADFLDLQGEFSDTGTHLHFMMPSVAHLMAAFGRHGVGPGTRVALYSSGTMMWATRFWWMLRSLGFDNAAVLDGGLDKWKAEGRPLETGAPRRYPAAIFAAAPRDGLFVDAAAVKAAIGRSGTVTVNALGPQFHRGLEPSRYGRPGRVPGSVNVSAATLVDPATKGFTSLADAAAKFAAQGVSKDKRTICYAAAAYRPPSTCSCCTNSATTTSRSTTAPWASGRRPNRCRSRRTDRGRRRKIAGLPRARAAADPGGTRRGRCADNGSARRVFSVPFRRWFRSHE